MSLPMTNISIGDVNLELWESTYSLKGLCTSENISTYSTHKPICCTFSYRNNHRNDSWTDTVYAHNCGFDMGQASGSPSNIYNIATSHTGEWTYVKPSGSDLSPYCLGDFRGYNHWATSSPVTAGYTLDKLSGQLTINFTNDGDITPSRMAFTGDTIFNDDGQFTTAGWYYGCVNPDSNGEAQVANVVVHNFSGGTIYPLSGGSATFTCQLDSGTTKFMGVFVKAKEDTSIVERTKEKLGANEEDYGWIRSDNMVFIPESTFSVTYNPMDCGGIMSSVTVTAGTKWDYSVTADTVTSVTYNYTMINKEKSAVTATTTIVIGCLDPDHLPSSIESAYTRTKFDTLGGDVVEYKLSVTHTIPANSNYSFTDSANTEDWEQKSGGGYPLYYDYCYSYIYYEYKYPSYTARIRSYDIIDKKIITGNGGDVHMVNIKNYNE